MLKQTVAKTRVSRQLLALALALFTLLGGFASDVAGRRALSTRSARTLASQSSLDINAAAGELSNGSSRANAYTTLTAAANAAIYTVDNTNDFTFGQNCTAAPNDCTLRAAITFANNSPDNDTINFDPAVFSTPQELALGSFEQFTIANNGTLTINGPGARLLSLNGVNLVRVFNVSAGATATISGITIRNGFTTGGEGGGIRNAGNLTVNSCEIKFNTGSGSDPFRYGGGGGIWNVGNLNLINSTVYGNTAIKSTQNNSSSAGGGILNYSGGTANIINSTISGNTATAESGGSGGGIWNEGTNNGVSGVMTLINSTVAGNMLEGNRCDGGGVFNNGGTVNARNTIFAGNTGNCAPGRFNGPDFNGRLVSQGYNLIGIQECFISGSSTFCRPEISGNTTGNILNVNAQLGPLADNGGQTLTHALLAGSPAINAGSNALAVDLNNQPLTTDQRGAGFPRINNGAVDMGAYETLLLPANTTTTITADTPDPSNVGQSVTVSYTVTASAGTPTGNVTVTDGVNSCVGTVAAGSCSLTLNTVGNRTLTASYSGATLFNPSTSAGEPHSVNPNAPLDLVVDNTSDNGALSACTNAANDCSLRGAVSRANTAGTNDTINFDSTVFATAQTIILSNGELLVTNNGGLTINGTGANLLNISGGGGSNRVFNFNTNSPVVLNSLTVSGGNASDGGGILANPTSVTINSCNISGNNATGFGGGIYNIIGTMNINSSTVSGNTAGGSGGGIANGGNPSVLDISNSTISGNTSNGTGGGGIFLSGRMTVYNSTITNNTANGNGTNTGIGGGISNFTFETVSLGNTIVAGNNAPNSPDFRDALNSLGHNLIGNTSGTITSGNTDGNLLNVNPLLGSLTGNGGPTQTHALLPGSPAINGGNNFLAVDTNGQSLANDQRGTGFNRIVGTTVDIGAYENNLPVITEHPQTQTVGVGAPVTFTSRAGVFSQTAPSSLSGGQALLPGQFLISPNYGYQLIYQGDGNLVLYRGDGAVLWNAGTFGTSPGRAEMQTDGNFVIYDANNNVQFSAGTFGNPGATLALQDDGNAVIYNGTTPIYTTNTGFTGANPIPTVQWQVSTDNGANFTNIGGATTPILSFTAQLTDNGKQYRAVFTNTFGATASAAAILTVVKADTTTTITSDSPDPSAQGQSVTVSYNVAVVSPGTGTPTGNVTVSDGVDSCVGTVAAGQCSLTLNTIGSRTLTATYAGDANFNGSVSAGEPHQVNSNAPLNLVVDNTSDDGNLSACTAAANDCSLRGAVSQANAVATDDTINFEPGIFSTPQTITLGGTQLSVDNSGALTILGPGANLLTISGNNSSRILEILNPVSVSLSGLTLTQGNGTGGASAFGGAIRVFNIGASLNLDSISVSGNNSAAGGGGVQISFAASANITNSTISNNTAAFGGGGTQIETPTVVNIINTTISGNASNNSTSGGGGIRLLNGNGVLNITNSTITNNTTGFDGGGIRQQAPYTVNLRNTIVAGNIDSSGGNAPDIEGTITSQGYNLIGDGSGGTLTPMSGDQIGTNASPINALLAPLANNGGPTFTHALMAGSPAINTGNNTLAVDQNNQPLTNDQRGTGFNRIVGTTVDMGAYENMLPVVTENPQSQTVLVGTPVTFTSRAGVFSQTAPSSLASGEFLLPGQFLISPNYGYQLFYQPDGNLVLYRGDGVILWNSGTVGTTPGRAEMQTDGNFVIYDAGNNALFSTGTFGNPGATLALQSDGNVVIYSQGGSPLFTTGTGNTGNDPIPAIQWQVSTDNGANFTDIIGATAPNLSFTTQLADNGKQYRAVFTNTSGAVTSSAATLTVNNNPPSITAAAPLARQQGSAGSVSTIATVNDSETPVGSLVVTATTVPTGITVTSITNSAGTITANVAADCTATIGANTVVLTVTDGNSGTATANLMVNVTANTAPSVTYANASVNAGASTSNSPTAATDNGSITGYAVQSQGTYTGTISVNASGLVSISNAAPVGAHTITIRATDNCGATSDASFTLTVGNNAPMITAASTLIRQQGSAGIVATIATVSDSETPAGNLTVTATTVPTGITVTSISNVSGTVSSNVAAGCSAALGNNTVVLTVTDANGGTATANLIVNVIDNAAPTLVYPASSIALGSSTTINPTTASDNGSITGYSIVSVTPAMTVVPTVNSSGVVSINNAGPFGSHTIIVRATDNCSTTTDASFMLNVGCGSIAITPATLVNGLTFVAYTETLSATGGSGSYTFSLQSGTLPAGLALNGNIISGTPTTPGPSVFLIRATDNNGCFGERQYTLNIGSTGLMYYPLARPVRLLDTRPGASPNACFQPNAPVAGGTSRLQPARGTCEGITIPANAMTITGHITTVQSGGGSLTLYPSDAPQPNVSNSNYLANEILNNAFTVGLGVNDGAFKLFVGTNTDVVIDVTGYYAPPGAGGLYFHPLPKPIRLLETRTGFTGCQTPGAPLQTATTRTQTGVLTCDGVTIPTGALALVGNATTTNSTGSGYLTLYPADATQPFASSSNFAAGVNRNAPFTVGLSLNGEFNIYTARTTDLVIDVMGYYSTEANDANGQGLLFNSLGAPLRLLDTRVGQPACYQPGAPMTGGTVYTQETQIPCTNLTSAARGLVGNVSALNATANGYLTFWPSNAAQPTVATSNYQTGRVFNRHFTVGLGTDAAFKRFAASSTDVIIDISGFFAP